MCARPRASNTSSNARLRSREGDGQRALVARVGLSVVRAGELVQTATGRITHGYALILDRHAWEVVPFDERTLAALRGEPLPARPSPNGGVR